MRLQQNLLCDGLYFTTCCQEVRRTVVCVLELAITLFFLRCINFMDIINILTTIIISRVDKRERKENVVLCIAVCKHIFEEYRDQLVQYCTQNALIYPQTSGLVTTTTATSCSLALQGWYCGHIPGCYYLNSYIGMVSLISVLFKGCLHKAIQSRALSFLLLILLIIITLGINTLTSEVKIQRLHWKVEKRSCKIGCTRVPGWHASLQPHAETDIHTSCYDSDLIVKSLGHKFMTVRVSD